MLSSPAAPGSVRRAPTQKLEREATPTLVCFSVRFFIIIITTRCSLFKRFLVCVIYSSRSLLLLVSFCSFLFAQRLERDATPTLAGRLLSLFLCLRYALFLFYSKRCFLFLDYVFIHFILFSFQFWFLWFCLFLVSFHSILFAQRLEREASPTLVCFSVRFVIIIITTRCSLFKDS